MTEHRTRGPHSMDVPPRAPILDSYLESIDKGELMPDPHQREVIDNLQSIADELLSTLSASTPSGTRKKGFRNFFGIGKQTVPETVEPVRGLYVWGGVGRGKTHLVDLFFENLPINDKLRLHFHRFMVLVHRELKQHPNVQDPLEIVAEDFARENRLLCLDEIHVHDITDAMLLGELFRHLFNRGVTLITTSNVQPNGLYHNGLQRQRFLPAIALLEQHTRVLHVGGDMDYRTRALEQAGTYHLTSDGLTDEKLRKEFHVLTGIERHHGARSLMINNRELSVVMWDDGIAWFTFAQPL